MQLPVGGTQPLARDLPAKGVQQCRQEIVVAMDIGNEGEVRARKNQASVLPGGRWDGRGGLNQQG